MRQKPHLPSPYTSGLVFAGRAQPQRRTVLNPEAQHILARRHSGNEWPELQFQNRHVVSLVGVIGMNALNS